jgi:hypothetical protein
MPSLIVLRSRLRVAVLLLLSLLMAAASHAQTSKPAPAKPAQPAPRRPAAPPATAKPAPAPAKAPEPPPPPDVTVMLQYVAGDKITTSTVAMKGARQRIDYGTELVVLQECDLGRVVQVSDANRKYLVAAAAPPAAATGPASGVVTYTTTVTDTGERKMFFNNQARHIRTTLTKEATPQSCDAKKERVETDGWYIDAPAGLVCAAMTQAVPVSANGQCHDEIRIAGDDFSKIGYPVAYSMTTTGADGKSSTMSMEVTDLARSTLPATLFLVPDGYTEVKSLEALSRSSVVAPKKPGVMRVGVAPVANKAKGDISLDALHEALVVSLGDAQVDAVQLTGTTPAEIAADARASEADFILTTDVAEVKQGGGGVLGKLSGAAPNAYNAKVDFKLAPVAGGSARLSDSQRSGTSTLKMALGAAKVVSMYVTPLGMMRMQSKYAFMNTFSDLSNGTSPATMQRSPDPVLNTVFSLVDRAAGTGTPQDEALLSPDAAVASAMEREVKAIAAELQKKR